MKEPSVVALCRQYAGADTRREKDRVLREVRYALEQAGEQPTSAEEVERAWRQLQQECQIEKAEAQALIALSHGYAALHQRRLKAARRHLTQAQQAAEEMRDEKGREHLQCRAQIAQVFARCEEGEYETALQEAEALRSQCEALSLAALTAELAHVLGLIHRRRGTPEEALEALVEARDHYEMVGDRLGAARVEDTLGMVFLDQGNFEEAIFHFQRSFAHKTAFGDQPGLAMTAGNLGRLYLQWEEFEKAREFLERDLALSRELNDERGQLIALNDLAEALLGQGETGEARRCLREADNLAGCRRDPFAQANTSYTWALLHLVEGNYEDALTSHRQAREKFGAPPAPFIAAHLDLQEGMIEAGRFNFGRARECFDRAIATFRTLKQWGRLAKALFECALTLLRQGLLEEAVPYLVEAMDRARDLAAQRMAERFQAACERVGSETWLRTLLAVKRLNQRLREEEAMRENLIGLIVHDLRGPLSAIGHTLKLVTDPSAQPKDQVEFLNRAWHQCRWLQELVGSILDAQRLEAGKVYTQQQVVALRPLIGELVSWCRPTLKEGVLMREAPESEDLHVRANEIAVRRVLMNLLHNAVKYTRPRKEPVDPEGHKGLITVGVRRKGKFAQVWVQDTGPGIPAEFLERIFTKFGQVQPGMKNSSTGLGLYFCRLAVEAQGGEIGVESEVSQGSTFWFTLPLA